jgi:hypothetical protein
MRPCRRWCASVHMHTTTICKQSLPAHRLPAGPATWAMAIAMAINDNQQAVHWTGNDPEQASRFHLNWHHAPLGNLLSQQDRQTGQDRQQAPALGQPAWSFPCPSFPLPTPTRQSETACGQQGTATEAPGAYWSHTSSCCFISAMASKSRCHRHSSAGSHRKCATSGSEQALLTFWSHQGSTSMHQGSTCTAAISGSLTSGRGPGHSVDTYPRGKMSSSRCTKASGPELLGQHEDIYGGGSAGGTGATSRSASPSGTQRA